MAQQSPFVLVKQLEGQVNSRLSHIDLSNLEQPERRLVRGIKRNLIDARLDIQDYELAETRAYQLRNGQQARQRLQTLQRDILTASEHGMFGPADIAHLTAQIELIFDNLR